jgi:acetyl-CoA synthase
LFRKSKVITKRRWKRSTPTHRWAFPNTAYYLPVIYSLLGIKVETLEDMQKVLTFCRKLLPPHIKSRNHLPYLGPLAGCRYGRASGL